MPISPAMTSHLQSGTTYLCTLWRVEERPREILVNWHQSKRVNVATRGGWLKKNAGTDGAEDAAALSSTTLTGDGYLRWVTRRNGTVYCGLSNDNTTAAASSILFAIRSDADGTIRIYESGTLKHTMAGTARAGDWLTVKRVGTQITYYRNRTLLYTSAATSSGTLYADASIGTKNATIEKVVLGHKPAVVTVTAQTASYSAAEQTADGLTPGNPVTLNIYQISARVGRGFVRQAVV